MFIQCFVLTQLSVGQRGAALHRDDDHMPDSQLHQHTACRFGTEHEKLAYNLSDNTRAGYDKIKPLLEGLCERYGWTPVMEGDNIIGAELDGQSVSLEPGGQFELSGAPLNTLHETSAEVNSHLIQVCCLPVPLDAWPLLDACSCTNLAQR